MGTVPDSIPGNVIYAIVDVAKETAIAHFLQSLDSRTQKYAEDWEILPAHVPSDTSRQTVAKAQAIAHTNGWDWDGIVAKALQGQRLIATHQETCLKNLDILWHKNDAKQLAFDREMTEKSGCRHA